MIPLLTGVDFFTQPDPIDGVIFGSIFVGLIVIAVIGNKISAGGTAGRGSSTSSTRRFNRFSFRRAARKAGLERSQIRLLERVARRQSLANPNRMFTSPAYLDRVIHRALRTLQTSDESPSIVEQRKYALLNVRRTLDRLRPQKDAGIKHTNQLRAGEVLTIITEDKAQFSCRLQANAESMLSLEAPTTEGGETILWDKNMPLKVTFRTDDGTLYGFRSHVIGYRKQRAKYQLFIAHSDKVRSVQKRKSPRREFKRPAYFFPVRVVQTGSGRSARREAVVDNNRRDLATIEDISAGGCALRTRGALKPGSLVKISFEMEKGRPVVAYGKVRGVDAGYRGNLLHIMFTKVSRENMTPILSYIYGYTDQNSHTQT